MFDKQLLDGSEDGHKGTPLQACASDWKDRAKVRHKIAGIRTWHINLNPAAMAAVCP